MALIRFSIDFYRLARTAEPFNALLNNGRPKQANQFLMRYDTNVSPGRDDDALSEGRREFSE